MQLWSYPDLIHIGELTTTSHDTEMMQDRPVGKVIQVVKSPVDDTVLTACDDEILRFWKVFDFEKSKSKKKDSLPVMEWEGQIR